MNLGFSEIIASIESEMSTEYLPGAIKWCDNEFDGAWSKAIDRFDKALSLAIERQNLIYAQSEGEFYKKTIIALLHKYKTHKKINDTKAFLESIRYVEPI